MYETFREPIKLFVKIAIESKKHTDFSRNVVKKIGLVIVQSNITFILLPTTNNQMLYMDGKLLIQALS